jgi:hypothetical protein
MKYKRLLSVISLSISILLLTDYVLSESDQKTNNIQSLMQNISSTSCSSNIRISRYSSSCYEKKQRERRSQEQAPPNPQDDFSSGGWYSNCNDDNCCTTDCPPCKASPVLTGGSYERNDVDFTLQGKGFSFDFTRYYYSSNRNIGSIGLAWTTRLDRALIIVGSLSERAYFQTGQNSIEFVKISTPTCSDCYEVVDKKKTMLIKSETIGTINYYVLYDYDAERKYVFFKSVVGGEPSSRGLLKAECDYYKNCWVYRYEEIKEGALAPKCIYNWSGDNFDQGDCLQGVSPAYV